MLFKKKMAGLGLVLVGGLIATHGAVVYATWEIVLGFVVLAIGAALLSLKVVRRNMPDAGETSRSAKLSRYPRFQESDQQRADATANRARDQRRRDLHGAAQSEHREQDLPDDAAAQCSNRGVGDRAAEVDVLYEMPGSVTGHSRRRSAGKSVLSCSWDTLQQRRGPHPRAGFRMTLSPGGRYRANA